MHDILRRVHNPKGRQCGCDPDCWCRRTAVGRAVKWWLPARFFGIRHRYGARTAEWKRSEHERRGD